MIYRPENVLFLGLGVYLLIFIFGPVVVTVPLELGSFAFVVLTTIALILGSRSADMFHVGGTPSYIPASRLKQIENWLFWGTFWLGLAGTLFRMVDKYVLRGVGGNTGLEARELLIDTGGGPLALIGGVLYPFGYLPIFVLLGARVVSRDSWKVGLAAFLFLLPALDALTLHSRSLMLVSLAMIGFGMSLTLFRGRASSLKLLLPIFILMLTVMSISVIVFIWRLDEMSFDILDSIFISAYSFTVAPSAAAKLFMTEGSATGRMLAGLLPIIQYYLHGFFEFQILWRAYDAQIFSSGALLLGPYLKFFNLLGLLSEPNVLQLFPRVGVFTSFWGPLWVDFGWFSPFVMFLFGFSARMLARAAQASDLGAIPIYTYFCVILFFMPVVNFAISAQGVYVINAFVLFWFMTRKAARAIPV